MAATSIFDPAYWEVPTELVKPVVKALRLVNGAVDVVFYDVPGLVSELAKRNRQIGEAGANAKKPTEYIDLDALANPEGCLLLADPAHAPFVYHFEKVDDFLTSGEPVAQSVDVVSITGVGSSALGSVAFAWDIAEALKKPVLAIVPGYGLADVVQQSLGGWFAFGLYNCLHSKSIIQNALAQYAPKNAAIGRKLSQSAPGTDDKPVFRFGSGSADVLHAIMLARSTPFAMVVGHSKGALQIADALGSLPSAKTKGLKVRTLGCPVGNGATGANYKQSLGLFDALGQLNMWGHVPTDWTWSWHTTNPWLPPAMDVAAAL